MKVANEIVKVMYVGTKKNMRTQEKPNRFPSYSLTIVILQIFQIIGLN